MAGATGEDKARGNMVFFDDPSSSTQQIQNTHNHFLSFEPNQEIFTNMENMIGFHPKNNFHQQQSSDQNNSVLWKDPSSSKAAINEFYNFTPSNEQSLMVSQFGHDHHSSSCTVFTCEGNERPSQGLSLSLSSSNPSSIGLQSFELRSSNDLQFGPSSLRSFNIQPPQGGYLQIRNSKYLGPAQELLNEFCNLGIKQSDHKMKAQKTSELQDDENALKIQSYPLGLVELQRRKTKLLLMLEELERRYKHYCDQMKGVVSSFEAVAGNGAAKVYSDLASRSMSRHFRCLRDGIVNQIKGTKKAMGEKDSTSGVAPGITKGETPRLRVLDQTLRQQRALQQMTMMESHPWRPQRGLPERSVSVLRAWLFEHFLHPYPSDVDKHILARQTGLSRSQVSNWFINARVRLWKPMVEEMYMEELKDHDGLDGALDGVTEDENHELENNQIPSRNEDQKPTHDQLLRIDSESLSSIVNNNNNNNNNTPEKNDSYGATLDFSSYSHHPEAGGAAVSYGGGSGCGGVSLTLGLHQHEGSGGVSLAFGSGSSQSSLLFPRGGEQMEDCQTVPYSLLDSESQNLPYRNLMGAQLLHDLAG